MFERVNEEDCPPTYNTRSLELVELIAKEVCMRVVIPKTLIAEGRLVCRATFFRSPFPDDLLRRRLCGAVSEASLSLQGFPCFPTGSRRY